MATGTVDGYWTLYSNHSNTISLLSIFEISIGIKIVNLPQGRKLVKAETILPPLKRWSHWSRMKGVSFTSLFIRTFMIELSKIKTWKHRMLECMDYEITDNSISSRE